MSRDGQRHELSLNSPSYPFPFPKIFSFPPFFTRQVHEATWRKQQSLWIDLLLQYYAASRLFELDLDSEDTYRQLPFANEAINRRVSRGLLKELAEAAVRNGQAAWLPISLNPSTNTNADTGAGTASSRLLMFWKKPTEWAAMLSQWVHESGGSGSIYTLYELIEGDETTTKEFHGLPESMARLVLRELEKSGKVSILASSASFLETGLKFT